MSHNYLWDSKQWGVKASPGELSDLNLDDLGTRPTGFDDNSSSVPMPARELNKGTGMKLTRGFSFGLFTGISSSSKETTLLFLDIFPC